MGVLCRVRNVRPNPHQCSNISLFFSNLCLNPNWNQWHLDTPLRLWAWLKKLKKQEIKIITSQGCSANESRGERRKVTWRPGKTWGCMLRGGQSWDVWSTVLWLLLAQLNLNQSSSIQQTPIAWDFLKPWIGFISSWWPGKWMLLLISAVRLPAHWSLVCSLSVHCCCRTCTAEVFLFCIKSQLLTSLVDLRKKRTS